jgi:hypothetical protein
VSRLPTALAVSLALCALSVFAGTAAAAPKQVPPDNSGAVQYTETLPGVSGDKTTRGVQEGKGGKQGNGKGDGLSAADRAKLEKLGKEGKDAARVAEGGSPNTGGAGAREAGGGESAEDGSGAEQVVGAATGSSDSGGPGWLLPLLIAAGVVAAVALVIVRRRPPPASD